MALTGDFRTLNKMRKRLSATPGAPERAAKKVEPLFLAAVQETFASQADPAGKPWKADKPKTYALGTKSILRRSDALYASVSAIATGAAVKLAIGASYIRFQFAKRNPLPAKSRIPKPWNEMLRAAVFRELGDILNGK